MKFLLTLSLFFCSICCLGQRTLQNATTLDDVAKVELTVRFSANLKYELKPNSKGNWDCWQTEFGWYHNMVEKRPKLIKEVPVAKMHELLGYFNQTDTSRNIAWFDLKYKELVRNIDSIKWINFTVPQRMAFMEVLANPDTLMAAVNRIIDQNPGTDRHSYNEIKLVTKSGEEFLAESTFDGFPHQLPWKIKGLNVYDWRLRSLVFELVGNEIQEASLKNYFYSTIVNNIYYVNFYTRFNWANFQADYPGAAALAGLSLVPNSFSRWAGITRGYFTSSLLPGNWLIDTRSVYPYVAMRRLKVAEKLLIAAYEKNKEGFDAIDIKPSEILFFQLFGDSGEEDEMDDILRELKPRFPELYGIDEEQLLLVIVLEMGGKSHSRRLVLPNGKLILI